MDPGFIGFIGRAFGVSSGRVACGFLREHTTRRALPGSWIPDSMV